MRHASPIVVAGLDPATTIEERPAHPSRVRLRWVRARHDNGARSLPMPRIGGIARWLAMTDPTDGRHAGTAVIPDLPNWAWHEYGMRVGFWRLKAALDAHGIAPSMTINGIVPATYP